MLAVFDWNEVLMKAVIGGVLGGIGGGLAYLFRKSEAKQEAEFEERERARINAQMQGPAKDGQTKSGWLILLLFPVIIVVCVLVVNPSLVTRLFRGDGSKPGATGGSGQPGATISEYGRYRVPGGVRVVPDRNTSSGVSTVRYQDVVLLDQTDQIPCQVGETWGIRIRFSDVPTNRPYTVRQETYHPPLKQPDGSVRTKSVREVKVPWGEAPNQFYGWHFLRGYESELVAGEWSIVVFLDDVEVARQVFHIRK
jgi:hypothetical protein